MRSGCPFFQLIPCPKDLGMTAQISSGHAAGSMDFRHKALDIFSASPCTSSRPEIINKKGKPPYHLGPGRHLRDPPELLKG